MQIQLKSFWNVAKKLGPPTKYSQSSLYDTWYIEILYVLCRINMDFYSNISMRRLLINSNNILQSRNSPFGELLWRSGWNQWKISIPKIRKPFHNWFWSKCKVLQKQQWLSTSAIHNHRITRVHNVNFASRTPYLMNNISI